MTRLALLFALVATVGFGQTLPEAIDNYPTGNGSFALSSVISPASLSMDQNNYAPVDATSASLTLVNSGTVRLTSSVLVNITGLSATGISNGAVRMIHNIGAQNIILKNNSSASTLANRFQIGTDITLAPNAVAYLQYDATATFTCWRAVSGGGGGGGGMTNPMTTLGDIITGGASGTPTRLGIGSSGQVLTVTSGAPAWGAAGGTPPGGATTQVQYNNSGAFGGSSGFIFDGSKVVLTLTGLGGASNVYNPTPNPLVLQLTNTTAAASGAQQVSPSLRWTGQGYTGSASEPVEFRAYMVPVQAATPYGLWNLQTSVNSSAWTTMLSVSGLAAGTTALSTKTLSAYELSLGQFANADETIYAIRFTDTSPTGNFLHFQNNAATTDVFKMDINGQMADTLGANALTALTVKRNTDTSPTGNFETFTNAAGTALWNVDITGSLTAGTVPSARVSGLPTFPTGAIVGTTDTQTLTNKTIASTQITGLPAFPTGTIVGTTDTQTLTNKRINPRVDTSTAGSATTWSPNSDTTDVFELAGVLTAAVTTINNPSGTPVEGQKLAIRVKSDTSAHALTWSGSQWRASGATGAPALPTTTTISKNLYMLFVWNSTDSRWDILAVQDGY